MHLSREEKERRIIDLYCNQGWTYRQIIKELRTSLNEIKAILKKEGEKTASNKNQQQQLSDFTKAYKLYFKGKSPMQVAIELNISESQTTQFYQEYWKLRGLYQLNSIYEKQMARYGHCGNYIKN
jgi:DNA-directed RNA polymerase specialized sigma subunit